MAVRTSGTEMTDVREDIGGDIHGPTCNFIHKYFNPRVLAAAADPSPLSPDSFPESYSISSQEEPEGSRGVWHAISTTPPRNETAHDARVAGQVSRKASTCYKLAFSGSADTLAKFLPAGPRNYHT
ncbi:hypothetical protein GGTG_09328 [Gaeumannomyces tritici R3-111a-1]|uniref:Uncharacterized protein n=1 Tax=Gaeumannomyces tritici (strain R3-111a-1) TaxID=644352 RepID=J3P731_GAET3|nr:hypothetical protein GGTG_09328 [Gaeumannomyces tritici R3-111a-1]EJT72462.1 hypothetical protein GGTG_09328 [Gaeumannomyces tritici R3-111a-1]